MGNKFSRKRPQIDDRYTKPQGLYQHKDVDQKKLRRLILESKLAPCYPGGEDAAIDLDECPICFLHYPSLNRSKCCTKGICTECFLQVKSPHSARPTQCPFCKTPGYAVEYRGAKTLEEKGVEQAEEQKVIEAKIRMRRQQEIQDEAARLQRLEQVSEDVVVATPSIIASQETDLTTTPAFPVFSGPAVVDERTLERMSPAERSWNSWTSVDRPAIGYPQSNFFTFPPVTNDGESMWFQRDGDTTGNAGVPRHQHSTSSVVATRNSSSFNSRRRAGWSNSSSSDFGPMTNSEPLHPNREDDFDLDLEEIMLMEAIWLSIQEQGSQRPTENSSESSFPSPFTCGENESSEQHIATTTTTNTTTHDSNESRSRGTSVTAGFASAIAALAERQVAGSSDPPSQQPCPTDSDSTGSTSVSTQERFLAKPNKAPKQAEAEDELYNSAPGDMVASNLNRWMREGSMEAEVGTSICSSTPSTSELPWEAPELGSEVGPEHERAENGEPAAPTPAAASPAASGAKTGVPETFEEQMMLAMAISLAEAQAHRKNNNGALPPSSGGAPPPSGAPEAPGSGDAPPPGVNGV